MEFPSRNRTWLKTHSDTDKAVVRNYLTTALSQETCSRYPSWNFLEERISRDSVIAIDSDS